MKCYLISCLLFFFVVPKYESEFAKVSLAGCKGKKKKTDFSCLVSGKIAFLN